MKTWLLYSWLLIIPLNNTHLKGQETSPEVHRLSKKINKIISPGAMPEIIAGGFEWSEGPLWIPTENKLIFSDIPVNSIFEWSEKSGKKLYLSPSGYTGNQTRGGEAGSNGLLLSPEGKLILCQHGDRRIAEMEAPLNQPAPVFRTLTDKFEGKRFNSPNDAVYDSRGNLYFTDPPYGLEKNVDDPEKELDFQGVYKLGTDRKLVPLTKELSRPNGIGLSPDEKKLYVANSDPEKAIWMVYDINPDGTLGKGKVFHDATSLVNKEPGLPDGLKVDKKGRLFATGPGGVWIFSPGGKVLGKIKTGQATANCAFNDDYSVLFITADMYIMRIKINP